jgi:hypothetical protein
MEFEGLLLCEHHFEEVGAREHRDRWDEIDLCLEMWLTVAHGWENETLLRLLECARLGSEIERESELQALKSAAKAGRRQHRRKRIGNHHGRRTHGL